MKTKSYVILALTVGLGPTLIARAEEPAGATNAPIQNVQLFSQLMAEGRAAFPQVCAGCHGPQASGKVGPALRKNLKEIRGAVKVVVNGRNQMPPVGGTLNDREIAAILTYVRNSWDNNYGLVTEEEVREFRKPIDF